MNLSNGSKSNALFAIAMLFLALLTVFESALVGMSIVAERVISFFLLVVPCAAGVVFGILGFVRKEPNRGLAALGLLLNGLAALFFLFLLSFAG